MSAPRVIVVDDAEVARTLAARAQSSAPLPLDVESNGLHAYRAVTCTVQVGLVGPDGVAVDEVVVLDPIIGGAAVLAAFRAVFGAAGPLKIVHDLAFDARMLARDGVPLANVFDTSLAARFLGVTSTSLASLVEARLGVKLEKGLQHHDWRRRPLGPELHG